MASVSSHSSDVSSWLRHRQDHQDYVLSLKGQQNANGDAEVPVSEGTVNAALMPFGFTIQNGQLQQLQHQAIGGQGAISNNGSLRMQLPGPPAALAMSSSELASNINWQTQAAQELELSSLVWGMFRLMATAGYEDAITARQLRNASAIHRVSLKEAELGQMESKIDHEAEAAQTRFGVAVAAAIGSAALTGVGMTKLSNSSWWAPVLIGFGQASAQMINTAGEAGLKSKGGADYKANWNQWRVTMLQKEGEVAQQNEDIAKNLVQEFSEWFKQLLQAIKDHAELQKNITMGVMQR